MKALITIIVACSAFFISARSQKTINIGNIIHANRPDVAENWLFNDIRKSIVELTQWPSEKDTDTVYAIESWNYEDGTFALMYWNRDKTISILQDNMGDPMVPYSRRAFTKRIISLVEEWNSEKLCNHPGKVSPTQTLYATRIILRNNEPTAVNTLCFPDIFLLEDTEDSEELFELWHPQKKDKDKASDREDKN